MGSVLVGVCSGLFLLRLGLGALLVRCSFVFSFVIDSLRLVFGIVGA